MKKWKSTRSTTFLLFLAWFALSFITSTPVSAYNFNYDGKIHYLNYSNSVLKTDDGNLTAGANGDNIRWTGISAGYSVREMQIYFQKPIATEPTLASFTITYNVGSAKTSWYYGVTWREALTLSDSCINNVSPVVNSPTEVNQSITCSYLVLINEPNLVALHGSPNGEIFFYLNQTTGDTGSITVTPFFTRGISNNGLSDDDRQWLQANMPSGTSQTDITNIQNKIDNTTNAIDNQTSTLNNSINSLQQETETGNQQAQDRWEQDKEEEADREEQGSDDMSSLTSIFRFEIRNPFMGLLGLFTNNCPVNIPVVAGMLGSSQTVYPCWFSQQTRGILTPVIGISSSMLLFGYLVRKFLNGSTFNDTMEF